MSAAMAFLPPTPLAASAPAAARRVTGATTARRPATVARGRVAMATPTPTRTPGTPPTPTPPPGGGNGDEDGNDATGATAATAGTVDAKALVAQYGGAYIATSLSLAAVSFGLWYAAVANGVDVAAAVRRLGDALAATPVGRPGVLDTLDPGLSTAALAYVAHKASSPLRFPLTVAATPFVARVLGGKKGAGEEKKDE